MARRHSPPDVQLPCGAARLTGQAHLKKKTFVNVQFFVEAISQEHPRSLTRTTNLAATYYELGRLEEAKKLQVHVLETSERTIGQEHPSTLTHKSNLAMSYAKRGQWQEAEKLHLHVRRISKSIV